MKTLIIVSFAFLLNLNTTTEPFLTIEGVVLTEDENPVIDASLIVKGTTIGTQTDMSGNFKLSVPSGSKTLVVSYVGLQTKEVAISESPFRIILKENSDVLDEIMITGYGEEAIYASSAPAKKMRREKGAVEMAFADMDASPGDVALAKTSSSQKVGPGLLTAGEWNDLNNWQDWKALIAKEEYNNMQQLWQIHPNDRYAVFLTTENNIPLTNAQVKLWSKSDELIWEAMTDNSGKAELWNNFKGGQHDVSKITVQLNKDKYTIKSPKSIEEGTNHLKLQLPCQEQNEVEIMFVVDATGSMGDEIQFLKSELADIITKAEDKNGHSINYRTGSVFYRDVDDDYLSLVSDLNDNINTTVDFINNQYADGGGDYPEAVHEGLQKAIYQDWNAEALSRIIFLVLDAPPHEKPEVLQQLQSQIKEAARLGIKIIPITASGINRETEFLMKFMAISTNGTYVFITDDSGIGNPHLTPEVPDYEVEKLNDLILRLIDNYSQISKCEVEAEIKKTVVNTSVYPNPAANFTTVSVDQEVDRIIIQSASGKKVLEVNDPKKGENRIELNNLVSGLYTVSVFQNNEIVETKRLIKLDS